MSYKPCHILPRSPKLSCVQLGVLDVPVPGMASPATMQFGCILLNQNATEWKPERITMSYMAPAWSGFLDSNQFFAFWSLGTLRCATGFHSKDRHSDGGGLCHGISPCIKVVGWSKLLKSCKHMFLESHDLWLCTKEVLVQETKDARDCILTRSPSIRVVCGIPFDILTFSLSQNIAELGVHLASAWIESWWGGLQSAWKIQVARWNAGERWGNLCDLADSGEINVTLCSSPASSCIVLYCFVLGKYHAFFRLLNIFQFPKRYFDYGSWYLIWSVSLVPVLQWENEMPTILLSPFP